MGRLIEKKILLGILITAVPFLLAAQTAQNAPLADESTPPTTAGTPTTAGEPAMPALPGTAENDSFRRVLDSSDTSADRHRKEITQEASSQLLNLGLLNSDAALFMSGYWKGSLSLNWGIANSPLGTAPYSDTTPLLFTQEADLTLSLWLWQKWFLEASFIDGYDVNTYRAGYQGFSGETVQYVGVGNTGLDFPVFPYLDLGGDSSSSFGVYGRFGSGALTFHTLFRYDAATREERIFVGNRERNFTTLIPNKPLRGMSFVLPQDNIPSIPVVYFEDKDGDLYGGGRRWRLARPSEYAVSARHGTVELAREANGMVAVSYSGGYALGSYSPASAPPFTPGAGFLGAVQDHFGVTIDLKAYPQPGGGNGVPPGAPATLSINGDTALVIYEPGTFSPFERQSRYRSPSINTEDAALIRLSSGERITSYELLPIDTLSMDMILFGAMLDERGTFELTYVQKRNQRDLITMWPLEDYPEMYLPGAPAFTQDMRIRFTNYGPAGAFNIGTDVLPGSVQVYRGGILDSRIRFEPQSGIVQLESPAGFNETIRISYLKRSQERRLGSLAAGAGVIYAPENSPFSAQAALGMRWNVSQESFTEENAASPGTVGFGARTSWDYEKLKASLSLGLGFEQPDTTGLYRIAGMKGSSEIVLGVSTSAGFISEIPARVEPAFPGGVPLIPALPSLTLSNRTGLIYRNYKRSNLTGGSEMMSIEWSAPVVSALEGPYPARDGSTDIFAAEFEKLAPGSWTGFQVPLGRDGELLEQAKGIIIPIRFLHADSTANVLVVAQFGVLAEEGYSGSENPGLMVEVPLFYGNPSSSWIEQNDIPNGKYVSISLTDEMRRKLRNANQIRLLVINMGSAPLDNRLLAAKPFIMGASWRAITLEGGRISAAQDMDAGVSVAEVRDTALSGDKIKRLNDDGINHVLKVEWKDNSNGSVGADGRTSSIPLSNYKVLSFYVKGPLTVNSNVRLIVSQGPDSYGNNSQTALELDAPVTTGHPFTDSNWHNVEIHYGRDKRLLIDGAECTAAIRYNPAALRQTAANTSGGGASPDGQSAYIAVMVTNAAADGSFSIDELCLEEPAPLYRINGGATLDWNHPGALISIGEKPVVSAVSFNTALESAAQGDPFDAQREASGGVQSRSYAQAVILDTRVSGNVSFAADTEISHWSAGHNLSREIGPLSITETFNTAPPPEDETMNHRLSLDLNTLVYGNLMSFLQYQNRQMDRTWTASTGITPKQNGYPGFSLEGDLRYSEKTQEVLEWMPNYAQTWLKSWNVMFPDDGSTSGNRNALARAQFIINRLPIGADVSFEGKNDVSKPLEKTNSLGSARVAFPFTVNPLRGSFRVQRDISTSINYTGKDIQDDALLYGQSLNHTAPLWRTVPIYSLFDKQLDASMDNAVSSYDKDSDNTRYYEMIGLNLNFPERYDALSLIVPVSYSGLLSRTMEQRLDTRLDVLTANSSLGFSAINLFGAMGTNPVFRFYRNDELRHSVTGTVSFPQQEDPVWRIQAEQFLGFYGFKGAEMAIENTYTVTSDGWLESFSLIWVVPMEKTLLSSIYDSGMKKLSGNGYFPTLAEIAKTEYERFFRETLTCVLDTTGDYGIYSASIEHESVVRITGILTLTGFIKVSFQREMEKDLLGIFLNFGTTISVSF
jgi:hypothetical protein